MTFKVSVSTSGVIGINMKAKIWLPHVTYNCLFIYKVHRCACVYNVYIDTYVFKIQRLYNKYSRVIDLSKKEQTWLPNIKLLLH